jgi:hypothetical protein
LYARACACADERGRGAASAVEEKRKKNFAQGWRRRLALPIIVDETNRDEKANSSKEGDAKPSGLNPDMCRDRSAGLPFPDFGVCLFAFVVL